MTAADDPIADDPSHPIPVIGVCDILAELKSGGADLVVVVASPLQNDERSRRRVIQKIRNYLGYIVSDDFAAVHGQPTPDNTTIIFHVHPGSDQGALAFIEECRPWIADNKASLVVKKLANHQPAPASGLAPGQAQPDRSAEL